MAEKMIDGDIENQSTDGATREELALQRTRTIDLQHAETVGSRGEVTKIPSNLKLGGGRPFPPELPSSTNYLVDFNDVDDPTHPHNWPLIKKCILFLLAIFFALVDSIPTGSIPAGSLAIRPWHPHLVAVAGQWLLHLWQSCSMSPQKSPRWDSLFMSLDMPQVPLYGRLSLNCKAEEYQ